MELKFEVQTRIQKPLHEVFAGVQDPGKLSQYFTTGGASGPLETGATVIWEFADFPGGFPVRCIEVIPNELIVFEWPAESSSNALGDAPRTRVEMRFEELKPGSTLVRIVESGWKETEADLKRSYGNCEGWMNMGCCLKAYLEYGINLRKGFFAD